MKLLTRAIIVSSTAALIGVAVPVFAEPAPVFDVDAVQQQFDSSDAEQAQQDLPPPPPPTAESGTFVPAQSAPQSSVPATSSMSMEQRMKRMEQQLRSVQNSESTARLDSLQEQIQSLRGQVEQLSHQLQQIQIQQKAGVSKKMETGVTDPAAVDSDDGSDQVAKAASKQDTKIAVAKPTVKTTAGADDKKSAADQPDVAEEQQIYQTAYDLIKAKKYNEAVTALQGMLKKYPSGQFASNAHYWLGELYGLMGKNDLALTEFSTVVSSYPDSPRVSDAQLKVGIIYSAQSKWPDAKASFKKVINHYPGTASARVASEQLKQIKVAGH
jgi:tol-pal system protein YbgF